MAYIFDSLGYAKRLRDGGVPQARAEVHAEAARDFIMTELASKSDVLAIKSDLLAMKQELQTEIRTRASELQTELRTRASELQTELRTRASELQTELHTRASKLQTEFRNGLEAQSLRLTVRLGAMIVVAIGALATILKLT